MVRFLEEVAPQLLILSSHMEVFLSLSIRQLREELPAGLRRGTQGLHDLQM